MNDFRASVRNLLDTGPSLLPPWGYLWRTAEESKIIGAQAGRSSLATVMMFSDSAWLTYFGGPSGAVRYLGNASPSFLLVSRRSHQWYLQVKCNENAIMAGSWGRVRVGNSLPSPFLKSLLLKFKSPTRMTPYSWEHALSGQKGHWVQRENFGFYFLSLSL